MTTSHTTTNNNGRHMERIPRGELAYICSRNQFAAHTLLVRAIKNSGLTQKQLSQLTEIDEASISRLLRRPRNMELNTFSKLFYAASRAALSFSPSFPKQDSGCVFRSTDWQKNEDTSKFICAHFNNGKTENTYVVIIAPIYSWDQPNAVEGDTGQKNIVRTQEVAYA